MAFTSVAEIQQHYTEAINTAGGDAGIIIELENQRRNALAEFREQQVAERERQVWVREAVGDFPLAKSFPQLVAGGTEEEVRESAKQIHEQLSTVFAEHQRNEQMRKLYEARLASSNNPPEEANESTV